MPTFKSGLPAAILVDTTDQTRLNNKAEMSDGRPALEITCFRAVDGAKEFMYGILAGAASFSGFLSTVVSVVRKQMATVLGKNTDAHYCLVGPAGLDVGYEALMFETKQTAFGADGNSAGVTSAGMQFELSGNGIIDGVSLHNPHGSTALSASARTSFTITDWPASHEIAIGVGDGDPQIITADMNAAAVQAKINLIDAYVELGITAVVTGTPTEDDGLYSGVFAIVFSGAVENIPQMWAKDAESAKLVATDASGDATPYVGVTASAGEDAEDFAADLDEHFEIEGTVVVGEVTAAGLVNANAGATTTYTTAWTDPQSDADMFDNVLSTGVYLSDPGRQVTSEWGGAKTIPKFTMVVNEAQKDNVTQIQVYRWDTGAFVLDHTFTGITWTGGGANGSTQPQDFTWTPGGSSTKWKLVPNGDIVIRELDWFESASADGEFDIYYPYDAGNLTNITTGAGTGWVGTNLTNGGDASIYLTVAANSDGLSTTAIYNVATATGSDTWVDLGTDTPTGLTLLLNVIHVLGTTPSMTPIVEHTDDDGDDAPDVGALETLHTFDAVTAGTTVMFRDSTETVKRWVRIRWTISGTTPKFVFGCGLARA